MPVCSYCEHVYVNPCNGELASCANKQFLDDSRIDTSDIPEQGEEFFKKAKLKKMKPTPKAAKAKAPPKAAKRKAKSVKHNG